MYVIKKTEINEDIRDREVRLIDHNGDQLGVVSSKRAMELAIDRKMDLVKIAPNARPPVCKIMDYGKFKYEQSKKDKEAKKKQKTTIIKEIRLSLKIETNDINTKAKNAIKFLDAGDNVKVSLRFRGREMGHINLGHEVIKKFVEMVSEYGVLDRPAKMEGRSLVAFLKPKKS